MEHTCQSNVNNNIKKIFTVQTFPEELLIHIFSYLNFEELCSSVSLVCRQWYRLSKDATLWRKLTFPSEETMTKQVAISLLSRAPCLRELYIKTRNDVSDILFVASDLCPHVQILSLSFCDTVSKELLEHMGEKWQLTSLCLEGSRLSGKDAYEAIVVFQGLKRLNLAYCTAMENNSLQVLAESCKNLEYLNVDEIPLVYDDSVGTVLSVRGPQLTGLFLDGEQLTDCSFAALSNCQQLRQLSISFADSMTDKGLLSGIGKLTKLTWLRIRRGFQLGANALASVFSGAAMCNLHHLDLSECMLLDNNTLRNVSQSCPYLSYLATCWCSDITDEGLSYVISSCHLLKQLVVVGLVRLTGSCLSSVPPHLPRLEYLDMEQCSSVDDKLLVALVERCPEVKVIDYYSDRVVATAHHHVPDCPGADEDEEMCTFRVYMMDENETN